MTASERMRSFKHSLPNGVRRRWVSPSSSPTTSPGADPACILRTSIYGPSFGDVESAQRRLRRSHEAPPLRVVDVIAIGGMTGIDVEHGSQPPYKKRRLALESGTKLGTVRLGHL
jgi:hypothetical protein